MKYNYPFAALAGQDAMKEALLLSVVDPSLSGVLLEGEKGTAKSTAVRSLAELLPGERHVVNLPISATEDRVVGSFRLEDAIKSGQRVFEPGLLKEADGNILYVDEVNLLDDYLVDVLLDAAAMGVNHVERAGISYEHPARFVLVGTMNPEEGELRPQLLDRFGLSVSVVGEKDPEVREEVVTRCLQFEADPEGFCRKFEPEQEALRSQIQGAMQLLPSVELPEEMVKLAVKLALSVGVEGHRADIMLCKTARAAAALDGRNTVTKDDLMTAATYVLPHRVRKRPFEKNNIDWDKVRELLNDEMSEPEEESELPQKQEKPQETEQADEAPARSMVRPAPVRSDCGKVVRSEVPGNEPVTAATLDVGATVLEAAAHSNGELEIQQSDLRRKVRMAPGNNHVLFLVDASGSVGAHRRMKAVKTLVLALLKDSYQNRDRVGLVAFRKDSAEEVLPFTDSVERARQRLDDIPTGGRTPLAEGLETARTVMERERRKFPGDPLVLIILTDGRANAGDHAMERAKEAAAHVASEGYQTIVIDTEQGLRKLGLAEKLALDLGAKYWKLEEAVPQ